MDDEFLTRVAALAAAGEAQSLNFDPIVARVATDRFVSTAAPSAEAIARYADLMRAALGKLDRTSALRIAEKLATCPAAPASVLAGLVAIGPDPAATIFARARRLPPELLRQRAEQGDVREAVAICGRADLDRHTVVALARRLEMETLRALAANRKIALDRGATVTLAQRARFDVELGRALLARNDEALNPRPLFLSADPLLRRRVILDAQRDALAAPGVASPLERAQAQALAAAERADRKSFCTAIAIVLRVGRASIEQLAADGSGEPLGLLFAAMGLSATEATPPLTALRPDLADALGDPASGLRLALQASAGAAYAIVAAMIGGGPQSARAEELQTREARRRRVAPVVEESAHRPLRA